MKGLIFTEFLEMVESEYSLDMVDQIITAAELPSGGAYTAVGTYPHTEIVQLVLQLADATGTPVPELLQAFGERLFQSFSVRYAHFLKDTHSAFDLLEHLQTYIHAEVQKLYPEAELPHFETECTPHGAMKMIYRSHRSMGDVAHGLIIGCFRYFGEEVQIERNDCSGGQGTKEEFILTVPNRQAVTADVYTSVG